MRTGSLSRVLARISVSTVSLSLVRLDTRAPVTAYGVLVVLIL